MSNPPNTNMPASEAPIQGYSLTSDPTSAPLPTSPETAEPPSQSFGAPSSGPGGEDGGSKPGETVLSYDGHEEYAPPAGPPPASTRAAAAAAAVANDEAMYASNAQLASLHAIFPDFDAETLQSVLGSVGHDQDRAVDTLLGMSDPAHVRQKSQTELDEEFARHLMLQEQEAYNQAQRAQGERWMPRRSSQEQPRAGERDAFAEVQEQVTKLAESGKRTFSSLLTKAKAKLQELDQSRQQAGSSSFGEPIQAQIPAPGLDRHAQTAAYAPNTKPGHDFASSGTPPPPRTLSGAPHAGTSPARALDPSEVGLLPKKPVALQAAQSGSVGGRGGTAPPEDDGDELEYVENPFEERRR